MRASGPILLADYSPLSDNSRVPRPFGITFAGNALSEATLLSYAYAFEQTTQARKQSRPYAEAMPKTQLKDIVQTVTQ